MLMSRTRQQRILIAPQTANATVVCKAVQLTAGVRPLSLTSHLLLLAAGHRSEPTIVVLQLYPLTRKMGCYTAVQNTADKLTTLSQLYSN